MDASSAPLASPIAASAPVASVPQVIKDKFQAGHAARTEWSRASVFQETPGEPVEAFNKLYNDAFVRCASIKLDERSKVQTVLRAEASNPELWRRDSDCVYLFVRNGLVAKIGGSRHAMKERWGSYLCGHHVLQRGKSGKMSVTNAHVYHTIEDDLLSGNEWQLWVWVVPEVVTTVRIGKRDVEIRAQVFHAYEAVCIQDYKDLAGVIPVLCFNHDQDYVAK
jgi:hypothetical protein